MFNVKIKNKLNIKVFIFYTLKAKKSKEIIKYRILTYGQIKDK